MYSVDIKDCVFRHVLESGLAGGKICNKTANASSRYFCIAFQIYVVYTYRMKVNGRNEKVGTKDQNRIFGNEYIGSDRGAYVGDTDGISYQGCIYQSFK